MTERSNPAENLPGLPASNTAVAPPSRAFTSPWSMPAIASSVIAFALPSPSPMTATEPSCSKEPVTSVEPSVRDMDFSLSPTASRLHDELLEFMDAHVLPAEPVFREQLESSGDPHFHPPVMEELKAEARRRGLWNLFLPHKTQWTDGLSNLDYAPLAEVMGRSGIASEACNCSAPDTGNMELLAMFGTAEQQEQWLQPLLEGEIRSAFAMTEPAVASSDATNIECRIDV